MIEGPAYRIETERLALRCFEPHDTESLKALVDANLDRLRPWMDWARDEPTGFEEKLRLVRRFRADFDLGEKLAYAVLARSNRPVDPQPLAGAPRDDPGETLLGACALHVHADERWGEIGYWLAREATGKGLATEAAGALVRAAFEIERLQRVEIHCDADNVRSARVAERLGFACDATLRRRKERAGGERVDRMVWSLFADETRSLASAQRLAAWDVLGRTILDAHPTARRGSAFP